MRAVVFDLGGVLFHYDPEVRWQHFASITGSTPETARARLQASGYAHACDLGALKGERAHAEGLKLLGARLSMERFCEIWVSVFTPHDAVIALARKLKQRCALALLTNNSDLVRIGLESAYPEVMELFRPRIFSADLGIVKPDPRLFAATLDLLGTTAGATLLVDDAGKNTATADSLGMPTVTFTNATNLEQSLRDLQLL